MSLPPDPRLDPLVADLTLSIGQIIRRLRAEADPEDLNLSQLSVLARLDREGAMTTADLARAEAMKPQSMGAILAGLEEAGLVDRTPHPTDGRQVLIALTPTGAGMRARRGLAKRDWLVAALASGVTAACLFVPGLKRLFEFGTPTPASLAVAVAIGLAATLVFDLAKRSVTVQRILGRAALDPHPKETTP